jgi:hypothetical protein
MKYWNEEIQAFELAQKFHNPLEYRVDSISPALLVQLVLPVELLELLKYSQLEEYPYGFWQYMHYISVSYIIKIKA